LTKKTTRLAIGAAAAVLVVGTFVAIRGLRGSSSSSEVEQLVARGDVSGAAQEVSRSGFAHPADLRAVQRFSLMVLRQGLKERDPYERCYAAAALAQGGEGVGIPVLRAAFDAPEPTLKMAAIDGLGEINDPASKALLRKLYSSSPVIERRVLLEAMARSGDPDVKDLLIKAANGDDQVTRLTAIRGLAKSGNKKAALEVEGLMSNHEDALERAELGRALIALGDKIGIETESNLLHDPKRPEVRAIAALGLGEARDKSVLKELQAAMADPDTDVRLAVAMALTHYRDATAVSYLKAAVLNDDALTRQHISQLLDGIDFESGRPVIIAAMASPDENLSMAATRTMGLLGGESDVPALRSALQTTKDPIQRAGIAWALGRIARPNCIPELMAMVPESDPAVRYTAADALGRTATGLLAGKPQSSGHDI
jgi:HEAT repeat protein